MVSNILLQREGYWEIAMDGMKVKSQPMSVYFSRAFASFNFMSHTKTFDVLFLVETTSFQRSVMTPLAAMGVALLLSTLGQVSW